MTDKDITKLAAKLTKSLATQENVSEIKNEIAEVKEKVQEVYRKLDKRIAIVEEKADGILELVDNINEDHEKRLKRLEKSVPAAA